MSHISSSLSPVSLQIFSPALQGCRLLVQLPSLYRNNPSGDETQGSCGWIWWLLISKWVPSNYIMAVAVCAEGQRSAS